MTTSRAVAVEDLPGGPVQPLPLVSLLSAAFWSGGASGQLRILRCQDCGFYVHPPRPVCARCLSRRLEPEAVSGNATVYTFSINAQPWYPGQSVPYVVAIVELPEQPALRLTTNILGCAVEDVAIGMAVRVVFVEVEDVFIPMFESGVAP
ncbi:MAG TPA: OB-fold domain-containing protein [Acidimicrobiales bacterium]|nr:OB-fold domain-containing protein [Acidimicrobiales bacterium]